MFLLRPIAGIMPLDLAPKFWSEIVDHVGADHIVCVDRVQAELIKGNDELANWIKIVVVHFFPLPKLKQLMHTANLCNGLQAR